MSKDKRAWYYVAFTLYWKGKSYGGTTRRVGAGSIKEAIEKTKRNQTFKKDGITNEVVVTKIWRRNELVYNHKGK